MVSGLQQPCSGSLLAAAGLMLIRSYGSRRQVAALSIRVLVGSLQVFCSPWHQRPLHLKCPEDRLNCFPRLIVNEVTGPQLADLQQLDGSVCTFVHKIDRLVSDPTSTLSEVCLLHAMPEHHPLPLRPPWAFEHLAGPALANKPLLAVTFDAFLPSHCECHVGDPFP